MAKPHGAPPPFHIAKGMTRGAINQWRHSPEIVALVHHALYRHLAMALNHWEEVQMACLELDKLTKAGVNTLTTENNNGTTGENAIRKVMRVSSTRLSAELTKCGLSAKAFEDSAAEDDIELGKGY